ncbi:MAG TPA: permease-like cell division protein FtsX [Ignavibacteria bacterium]|nr:permease-like cell division protein FtsX [Ignavibacteria bacterium]
MNFKFIFRESIRGFNNAKLSTFASILTITISLVLITLYYVISIRSNETIKALKNRVELEVFLVDSYSTESLDSLRENIKRTGGVKVFDFFSKEEAYKKFEEDYGKEMLEIFEYNPLPASFRINLYDEYKSKDRLEKIKEQLSKNPIVSDIIYPQKDVELIESMSSSRLFYNLVILIIVIIASLFLVSNTIRLVIFSKRKNIEVMKLLGSTRFFIQAPFLIEGIIQGLLGSVLFVISLLIFKSVFKNTYLESVLTTNYWLVFGSGILLGLIGSAISVRMFFPKGAAVKN